MKRPIGLLAAVAALGGAYLASREVDADRARTVRREAQRAAEAAAQRVYDTLCTAVSDLKLKVENAAANPRLVFALQGDADEKTLRDLWRTEDWWRPWRTEFKVYAIASTGTRLDAVEGIPAGDLDAEVLIKHAREKREAVAEIIVGKGWPYAATATLVPVPLREVAPVLLLAKPIDQAVLRRVADKAQGAVALTDGRAALVDAGPEAERAMLKQLFGSEGRTPVHVGADGPAGAWAAAVTPVVPGLWIWAYAGAGAVAREAEAAAGTRRRVVWGLALAAAAVSLVVAFRRRGAQGAAGSFAPGVSTAGAPGALPASPPLSGSAAEPRPRTLPGPGAAPPALAPVSGEGVTELANPPPPAGGGIPFGRYTLLDRLGEGGMGEVFTAVTFGAEGFRRKFVVKRLRVELARDPSVVAQFIDEANLASTLVHSNVVPVFDFGKVGDEYFLAQEYILGRDLARLARRSLEKEGRALTPAAALYAVHETLRALEYAHAKTGENGQPLGIVHRDVSPSNVMVSARGEVKLFDFGIVKAEGRVTKTQSGVVKGNVTFMSPEQARGADVDARADLFSLGLVLYFCLAGEVLYRGQTTYELLVKAASGPGPEELARIDALPAPCPAILRRALAVPVGDRFQTAHEFLLAVAPHIAGGALDLAAMMPRLFVDDLREEEARFGTPTSSSQVPRASGTQEAASRKTR